MASLPMDDRDLDDAELWAVIDSAAAAAASTLSTTLSSSSPTTATKFRKPPSSSSITPKFKSPLKPRILNAPSPSPSPSPLPSSSPSSSSFLSKTPPPPNYAITNSPKLFSNDDLRHFNRPRKISRSSSSSVSEISDTTPDLMIVKQFPVNQLSYPSPIVNNYSPQLESEYRVCDDSENFSSHCLAGRFPTVSVFKDYQDAAMSILEKSDYTVISGNPFIKKSGWRKIAFYFNVSFEIRDKTIEFDENRNVQRAEFVARAYMQGGRFSDGWGSCERREKKFLKPNNDIPSTAETRAKNRACQDLLGIGQYRPSVNHSDTPR